MQPPREDHGHVDSESRATSCWMEPDGVCPRDSPVEYSESIIRWQAMWEVPGSGMKRAGTMSLQMQMRGGGWRNTW